MLQFFFYFLLLKDQKSNSTEMVRERENGGGAANVARVVRIGGAYGRGEDREIWWGEWGRHGRKTVG